MKIVKGNFSKPDFGGAEAAAAFVSTAAEDESWEKEPEEGRHRKAARKS